jgi:hypothetical protein
MTPMSIKHLLFALALSVAVFGCSSGDAASTAPAAEPGATTVAMAKCAGCAKEVPQAELVSHDGQMLCKDCIAAHNH